MPLRRLVSIRGHASLTHRLGWAWVALSIVVLCIFGGIRIADMLGASNPQDPFAVRYVEHPTVAILHFGPGLLFLLLAPFQFIPGLRKRYLRWHRLCGRVLVVLAALSGVFAVAAAFVLPAFGGLPTQVATVVFGFLFLWSLAMAVRAIRQRRVAVHREWMIRVFAVSLGVATIRAVVALSQLSTGLSMEAVFGFSFWVGLSVNALVAEAWIRATRRRPSRGSPAGATPAALATDSVLPSA